MRPIIIVVEGPTEKRFVDECLAPFLLDQFKIHDVSARVLGVPGKKGGDVSFDRMKFDINLQIKTRGDVIVTMLVDYYGMRTNFPDYKLSLLFNQIDSRIIALEKSMNQAIDSRRFVAYFQKHELEALLFSKGASLDKYYKAATCEAIQAIRQTVDTPEDINTNQPPSYRLLDLFPINEKRRYEKVFDGPLMALELGMNTILADCPRFAHWVQLLVQKASMT